MLKGGEMTNVMTFLLTCSRVEVLANLDHFRMATHAYPQIGNWILTTFQGYAGPLQCSMLAVCVLNMQSSGTHSLLRVMDKPSENAVCRFTTRDTHGNEPVPSVSLDSLDDILEHMPEYAAKQKLPPFDFTPLAAHKDVYTPPLRFLEGKVSSRLRC